MTPLQKEHSKSCSSHPDSPHYHQPCSCSVLDKKYIGKDMHGKLLFVGDIVSIQQCWEDEAGYFHDESGITISGVNPAGTLKFRFGDWHFRTAKEQKIQAFMNGCEFYAKDVEKE